MEIYPSYHTYILTKPCHVLVEINTYFCDGQHSLPKLNDVGVTTKSDHVINRFNPLKNAVPTGYPSFELFKVSKILMYWPGLSLLYLLNIVNIGAYVFLTALTSKPIGFQCLEPSVSSAADDLYHH